MSLWNKIVIGLKFTFVGFEAAADYALRLLNAFLSCGDIAKRVQKAREYVTTVLEYLIKYRGYCPAAWLTYFDKVFTAATTLNDAFADNKVTTEELQKLIAEVRAAIDEWFKD